MKDKKHTLLRRREANLIEYMKSVECFLELKVAPLAQTKPTEY